MANYIPMDHNYEYYLDGLHDPHDIIVLLYDPLINRFIDGSFGDVIHNIYQIVTPWQVSLFKAKKEDMAFTSVNGDYLIELVWPEFVYVKDYS